eukprot:g8125.t1
MAPKKDAEKKEAEAPKKEVEKKEVEKKEVEKKEVGKKEVEKKEAAAGETSTEKPKKPDEAKFKKETDDITAQINAKRDEMQKLSQTIEKRNTGKEEYDEEKQRLYAAMNEIKGEQKALIDQKKTLNDMHRKEQKEEREAKRALADLAKGVENLTEEGIDKTIREKEYFMAVNSMTLKEEKEIMMQIKNHAVLLLQIREKEYFMAVNSMTLKEEKEIMQQIKKLKQQRPQAQKQQKEYEMMKAKCESANGIDNTASFTDQTAQLEAAIKEKKTAHEEFYEKIQKLKTDRDAKMDGFSDLIEKKKKLKAGIDELVNQRQQVKEQQRTEQKAFNQWEQGERKKRQLKMEEERKTWEAKMEAENAKWELEQPNPYLAETTLLEQTLDWCKNQLPKSEEAEEEEKKDIAAPDGVRVLVGKKERDTEMYFAATKKKALKKKGGDKAKATSIKHTAETLGIFDKQKVKAPMTTDDIPALQTELQKKLDGYMAKVKKWEGERAAKLDAAKNAEDAQATTSTGAEE